MELNEIKELIALFSTSNIAELELENRSVKLRLVKAFPAAPVKEVSVPLEQTTFVSPQQVQVHARANIREILSPMVGTFYRAPAPDSEPFVVVGSIVEKGQVLCIIEAMKIMNEIESEYSGRVLQVLVENGQPVEYGQPLFLIEVTE